MKELKLLQILPSLDSGGVEQGTVDVANYLASKGIQSFIASNGGRMFQLLDRHKVKHYSLPIHSKNIFEIIKNIKKIKKFIIDNDINVVHVRSRLPAWIIYLIPRKNFKTISTFHNIYGHQNYFKKKYNKAMGMVDKVIAISDFVKESINKIYQIKKNKIQVINRGVDTNFFDPNYNNEETYLNFLKEYNIAETKQIIVFPGRMTKWKGQIEFLKVIEILYERNNSIICYFVGDDKNEKYSKKLISAITDQKLEYCCKILGHLNKQNLRFLYKSANVIVSAPIEPEGFGRTISEGLSMSKIVLAYNYGGAYDQLKELDDFYKIEPFQTEQMVERIEKVFNFSSSVKSKMGKIARNHVVNNFSKDLMLKKYFASYMKIIK